MTEPPEEPAPAKDKVESKPSDLDERRRILADYVESLRELIRRLRGLAH